MANKLNVILGLDVSEFQRNINVATKKLEQTSKSFISAGQSFSAAFTLPFAAIAGGALKVSADFQKAMSEVKAVSDNLSQESFKRLEAAAVDLGSRTSKSATEAAQGLKFLALAGFSVEQQLTAIEPVLRLSEAGSIDLARASDLATDAMSALGLQADELGGFLDIVANTSTKSNTSIEQLNEAFIAVGGQFKNLGTPLDEANALLGILANRGIKGAEAGNGLSAVLINLATGAGQAGEAMEELGIEAFDADGNFKGISVILKELNDRFSTMTDEQQFAYKAMLGGKTRVTELNALLDGMANEFDDLQAGVTNSTGKLNEIAKVMQDNLQGKVTILTSTLEGLGIQLGEILLPIAESVVDAAQSLAEAFGELSIETKKTILILGGILAAIGPILLGIGGLIKVLSLASVGLAAVTKAAVFLRTAMITLYTTLGALNLILGAAIIAIAAIANEHKKYTNSINATLQVKKRLEEVEVSAAKATSKTKTEVGLLVEKLKDETLSLDEKRKIIAKLNEISPKYFKGLEDSKNLYEDAAAAAADFNKELLREARIQAAKEKLIEIEKELLEVDEKAKLTTLQKIAALTTLGKAEEARGKIFQNNRRNIIGSLESQRAALLKLINTQQTFNELIEGETTTTVTDKDKETGDPPKPPDDKDVKKAVDVLGDYASALDVVNQKANIFATESADVISQKIKETENAINKAIETGGQSEQVFDFLISQLNSLKEQEGVLAAQAAIEEYTSKLQLAAATARVFGTDNATALQEQIGITEDFLKSAVTNFGEGSEAVKFFSAELAKLKAATQEAFSTTEFIDNYTAGLEKLETVGRVFGQTQSEVVAAQIKLTEDALTAALEKTNEYSEAVILLQEALAKLKLEQDSLNVSVEEYTDLQKAVGNAIAQAGNLISSAIEEQGLSFKTLATSVLAGAKLIIKAFIQEGVAGYIKNVLAGPLGKTGPIALGIAAAGGAIAAGIFSSAIGRIGVPKLARGGLVTGEQLAVVGDNPSGKEAIIPFERMGEFLDMAGGGGSTRVTGLFEVRGQDLVLVLDRANQSKNRVR